MYLIFLFGGMALIGSGFSVFRLPRLKTPTEDEVIQDLYRRHIDHIDREEVNRLRGRWFGTRNRMFALSMAMILAGIAMLAKAMEMI